MSYLVLARKHRPQTFDEVIGQEHITDLLKKAVQSGRLSHAYLFCGPRGIGKTSCARILAKSLNCEHGPTIKPCGTCTACQEIAKGTSFDVLEIDGASNRGIDEIRTLRENVKFAPSYGTYKIYIVDEVHMLTPEAFNALLKTLEEPPEHVKFILATTAPYKVPATIISRCQRFDFKRIPIKTIVELLTAVSGKEKFKADPEALYAIAKSAQGSLRDALSVLDQLSALSEKGIQAADVFSMLGLVETQLLFELTDALSQKDCPACFNVLEHILNQGKDIRQLSKDITEHFRHLMVIKVGGHALGKLVDYPSAVKDMLLAQCQKFTLQEILSAIDAFIAAQETARITESLRMPLEVAFAKLTYSGEPADGEQTPVRKMAPVTTRPAPEGGGYSPVHVLKDRKGRVDISSGSGQSDKEQKAYDSGGASSLIHSVEEVSIQVMEETGPAEKIENAAIHLEKVQKVWDLLTHAVSREKMSLATYLQEGFPHDVCAETLTVGFPQRCAFQKEALEDTKNIELVERVFSDTLKAKVFVRYALVEEREPPEEAKNVKDAIETFEGKVVSRWHE
jgi:DNA polymerase-3 subunit gamma/tau